MSVVLPWLAVALGCVIGFVVEAKWPAKDKP